MAPTTHCLSPQSRDMEKLHEYGGLSSVLTKCNGADHLTRACVRQCPRRILLKGTRDSTACGHTQKTQTKKRNSRTPTVAQF